MDDILTILQQKFTSGNAIPVERITVTYQEWGELKKYINNLKEKIKNNNHGETFL